MLETEMLSRALVALGVGIARNLLGFAQNWMGGKTTLSEYSLRSLGETTVRTAVQDFGLGLFGAPAGTGIVSDYYVQNVVKRNAPTPVVTATPKEKPAFVVVPSDRESGTSPTSVIHKYRMLSGEPAQGRVGSAGATKEGTYVVLDKEVRLYPPSMAVEAERVRAEAAAEVRAAWDKANQEKKVF